MFGLSFGELVVLIVVAVVVIGPRDLPKMLGKLGRFAGKMRRMAADLRHQSGIDEVLRSEGIQENLTEIRKLARGELDQITEAARVEPIRPFEPDPVPSAAATAAGGTDSPYANASNATAAGYGSSHYGTGGYGSDVDISGLRDREYPREGADHGDALPDTAFMYTEGLAPSPFASDPLYMTGDPNGIIPSPPPPPPSEHPEETHGPEEAHEPEETLASQEPHETQAPGEHQESHEPQEKPHDLGAP